MLYPGVLGTAFRDLPVPLQAFHSVQDSVLYTGRVTVTHGSAVMRLLARSGGMPGKSGDMPFSFRATRDGGAEIWERNFDGHITRSRQWRHCDGVIAEKVGTSVFLMEPNVDRGMLHIPIIGVSGFGLPMPRGILASCEGIEGVTDDGKITFDVHASLRGLGLIIRYRGELSPA